MADENRVLQEQEEDRVKKLHGDHKAWLALHCNRLGLGQSIGAYVALERECRNRSCVMRDMDLNGADIATSRGTCEALEIFNQLEDHDTRQKQLPDNPGVD